MELAKSDNACDNPAHTFHLSPVYDDDDDDYDTDDYNDDNDDDYNYYVVWVVLNFGPAVLSCVNFLSWFWLHWCCNTKISGALFCF